MTMAETRGAPAQARIDPRTPIARALNSCRRAFVAIFALSGVLNLLALTGSIYMLQVYDRAIPARSVPTLVGLSVLAAALYVFHSFIDLARTRVLARIGELVSRETAPALFKSVVARMGQGGRGSDVQEPVRDLESIRGFLSSAGPGAIADLPWIFIYVVVVFLLHPILGFLTVGGVSVIVALTLVAEGRSRGSVETTSKRVAERNVLLEGATRGSEAVLAMGMGGVMGRRFVTAHEAAVEEQRRTNDLISSLGSVSKVVRMMLSSATLGTAAYLVIHGDLSAGSIFAANMIAGRATAPVDHVIGHWRGFMAARIAYARLGRMLPVEGSEIRKLALPVPRGTLEVAGLAVGAPGQAPGQPAGARKVLVRDVSFGLRAGEGVGVIGPSASGKSSLVRALVGVWQPLAGTVSLDGAPLDRWDTDDLGRHVGYLPQDVQLFEGTVAQNIARFREDATDEAVIAAARLAGLHELILKLPQGYSTKVGAAGEALSGGMRQRVGLARALYGDPFLVVLDEPNASLDQEGDDALNRALLQVRARRGVVVIVAHRQSALAAVDKLLVIREGTQRLFGPKDEVLKALQSGQGGPTRTKPGQVAATPQAPRPAPPRVVPPSAGGPRPAATGPTPLRAVPASSAVLAAPAAMTGTAQPGSGASPDTRVTALPRPAADDLAKEA